MAHFPGHGPGHGPVRSHDIVIGPLDLVARVDEALAVQAVAFGLDADEIAVRRQIVLHHMTCLGARALGATTTGGRLVGFVYGMPNDRVHWWSTVVEPYLRARGHEDWLDDSFVITELHVHPRHQNRGIGRALITTITDSAAEPRSILSAIDTDSPARGLYHSLGYQDLARQVLFPSAPKPYAVMGALLPLRRRPGQQPAIDFHRPSPPG
jgi:ribosomal protein S18 acetylase RimI-like enzyme